MTHIPTTKQILDYMRSRVDSFVRGNMVNDVEMIEDALDHFGCLDASLSERHIFIEVAYKVGKEKEEELNK